MKRDTLEFLMQVAKNEMAENEYGEVVAQMNATIQVEEVAKRAYLSSAAGQTRDAEGKAFLKWEEQPEAVRNDFRAIVRGALDGVLASGAFVRKDSADEPFGVSIVG